MGVFKAAAMGAPILASAECEKIPVALFVGLFFLSHRIIFRLHLVEKVMKTFGHFLVGCKNNLVIHLKNKASVFLVKKLVVFGRLGVEFVPASDPDSVFGDFDRVFCAGESACEGSSKNGKNFYSTISGKSTPLAIDTIPSFILQSLVSGVIFRADRDLSTSMVKKAMTQYLVKLLHT